MMDVHKIERGAKDAAMKTSLDFTRGGIDLTSDKALHVENNGEAIKFNVDPAMLKQYQNAQGLVPVIINVQPLKDLDEFLGIKAPAASKIFSTHNI